MKSSSAVHILSEFFYNCVVSTAIISPIVSSRVQFASQLHLEMSFTRFICGKHPLLSKTSAWEWLRSKLLPSKICFKLGQLKLVNQLYMVFQLRKFNSASGCICFLHLENIFLIFKNSSKQFHMYISIIYMHSYSFTKKIVIFLVDVKRQTYLTKALFLALNFFY
jgi:hypothetical protein